MHARISAFALALLSLSLVACRTPAGPPAPDGYTLVYIKTGPMDGRLAPAENARAFQGHFENMEKMASARRLLVAGPFGEQRHDPTLRGLFVLASADRAEAREWADSDPTTQVGIFVLELHALDTSAPLGAALERDLKLKAGQKAEGRTPEPGEGARSYVLLTAEDAQRAEAELAGLCTRAGGVFLLGRLDGTRAFAVLDAHNQDEARERFAPQLENLGEYVLDEWYASAQLEGMVD